MYNFSPRDLIASVKQKYPNESLWVDMSTVGKIVNRMINVNPKYSMETIENAIHFLINCQVSMPADENEDLHTFVKNNIKDMYENNRKCMGCVQCLDFFE